MYRIENNFVYIYDHKMTKVDAMSFVVLNELFAKDKRNVYVMGTILKGADTKSFQALKCELKTMKIDGKDVIIGGGYGKDDHSVFWYELTIGSGMVVKSADTNTFNHIGHKWGSDKDAVFYMGRKVPKAKPRGFFIIGSLYGQYNDTGFYGNAECERKILGNLCPLKDDLDLGIWAKDEGGVFCRGKVSTLLEYEKDLHGITSFG